MPYSITLSSPNEARQAEFITAMRQSQTLHHPWLNAPCDTASFTHYLQKYQQSERHISYWVLANQKIAGVINLNEIVRGLFQNAFMSYFAVAEFAGQGILKQGMQQVIQQAFTQHQLHRLEANIQPGNHPSIALVRRCGFQKEGYSPKYLKINGQWRDHERWALLNPSTDCIG